MGWALVTAVCMECMALHTWEWDTECMDIIRIAMGWDMDTVILQLLWL